MKRNMMFDHWDENELKSCIKNVRCRLISIFMNEDFQRFQLKKIKTWFDDWQMWEIWWMLKIEKKTHENFLCDDMRLKKINVAPLKKEHVRSSWPDMNKHLFDNVTDLMNDFIHDIHINRNLLTIDWPSNRRVLNFKKEKVY